MLHVQLPETECGYSKCYADTCFLPTSLRTPFSFRRVFIQLCFFPFLVSASFIPLLLCHFSSHRHSLYHPGSYLSFPLASCCHNPKLPAGAERPRKSADVSMARPGQASSGSQPAICSSNAYEYVRHCGGRKNRNDFGV